jgi:RNA polymerase sigma factor (sigma-70 family)
MLFSIPVPPFLKKGELGGPLHAPRRGLTIAKMADHPSTPVTSPTLLLRLRQEPNDQAAWAEFVRRYGPQVYRWCRRWRLQEADAEDVTQAVLLRLSARMRTFTYDRERSFRAYLRSLVRYAWCDYLETSKQPGGGAGSSEVLQLLQTVEAGDDLVQGLAEQFDQEMLVEAQALVQQRVEPHTWEAFRLTALEGVSGADAAARLGLTVAGVYKAKSRVQQMLQEEVARLEQA